MASFYVGEFELKGAMLREKGINRTGNILVPNENYCKFEEWMKPILDKMVEEQNQQVHTVLVSGHIMFVAEETAKVPMVNAT